MSAYKTIGNQCGEGRSRAYGKARQAGLTMIEAIAGLAILAITYLTLAQLQIDQAQDLRLQAAASQMILVRDATKRYVRDNQATIQTDAANNGGVLEVDTSELLEGGYLSPAMAVDSSAATLELRQNPFLQDYRILIRQPDSAAPDVLEVLVVTEPVDDDAVTLDPSDVGRLAQLMGAQGGILCKSTTDAGPCFNGDVAADSTLALGAYGGWSLNLEEDTAAGIPGFGALTDGMPEPGGAVGLAFTGADDIVADFLYRFEVPGVPEANQMFTNIDMNGNDIVNADAIGIRSTADTYDFEIDDQLALDASGGDPALLLNTGGGMERVLSSDGNTLFLGDDGNRVAIRANGNEVLTVDNAGNVNITGDADVAGDLTAASVATTGSILAGTANAATNRVEILPTTNNGDIYIGAREGLLSELLPNFVFKASFFEPNDAVIPMPSCPGGGDPKIIALPRIIPIPPESGFDAHGATNVRAEFLSPPPNGDWRVVIETFRVIDTGGGGFAFVQETPAQAWVLAQTYCYYAP